MVSGLDQGGLSPNEQTFIDISKALMHSPKLPTLGFHCRDFNISYQCGRSGNCCRDGDMGLIFMG